MSLFEITLVVEATDLSLAVGRVIYDDSGEPNLWLHKISSAKEVRDE